MGTRVVSVNEVLRGHVALDIECLDRIYLNAYVPTLQTSAQVAAFLTRHLGFPFPSPALFKQLGDRFRRSVRAFADAGDLPWVTFDKHHNKLEVMRPHLARQAAMGRSGVAAVGVAQEFQRVWTAYQRQTQTGAAQYCFTKADRRVTCYYFYLWDVDFGPGFVKVCAYFPYPAKIWLNGHQWVKRQAARAGIGFTELSNGFAACDDPSAPRCRRSVTGWDRATSTCSPSGGCRCCRCPLARPTAMPATGGSARCGRSRSRAPWCSTRPATPVGSSRR
jgi:hypothetical protein